MNEDTATQPPLTADHADPKINPIWIFVLCAVAAVIPLLFASIPPYVDYPNHLARAQILSHLNHESLFRKFYAPNWQLIPNLTEDLILIALGKFLPMDVAGRVLVALIMAGTVGGVAALNRALTGKVSWWPCVAVLLVHNFIMSMGFLNYLLGVCLLLWGLALYLNLRTRPAALRIAVGILFIVTLYFTHLVATGFYVVSIIAFEHGDPANKGNLKRLAQQLGLFALQAAVPAIIFLKFSPTGEKVRDMSWGSVKGKLTAVLGTIRTGALPVDLLVALCIVGLLGFLAYKKALSIDRRIALAATGVFALFILAPFHIATVDNFDTRIPLLGFYLLIAGTSLKISAEHVRPALAILLVGITVRSVGQSIQFAKSDVIISELRRDLDKMPAGSLLFVARTAAYDPFNPSNWTPPLKFPHCAALLDRPGFDSTVFTFKTQQPLVTTESAHPLLWQPTITGTGEAWKQSFREALQDLQTRLSQVPSHLKKQPVYLLYYPAQADPEAVDGLNLEASAEKYRLYRVN